MLLPQTAILSFTDIWIPNTCAYFKGLNFSDHIDFIVNRRNGVLGLLIRSLQGCGVDMAEWSDSSILCGCMYVRAVLGYESVVWSGAASSHLQRLERIQYKFLCFLAGTRRDRFDMSDYDSLCLL